MKNENKENKENIILTDEELKEADIHFLVLHSKEN